MTGHLPKTVQEVHTENPSKNAVTAPSDPALKEKDVARKMQLYALVQGFRQGKLPSNRQIDETLQYFTSHAPFDEKKLSSEGRELLESFRGVVKDANEIIKVKNKDELIQNFIFNTQQFDAQGHAQNIKQGVSAPASQGEARSEGQEAVNHLQTLGKLIFTNSEVRKLLSDVTVIGRDVLADAAEKAATKARPDEDALRQAEEAGPDSQWIGPDGQKRGPNEPVPDTGIGAKVDTLKEKKNQAQQEKENLKNEAANEAQDQQQRSQQRAQNVDPNDREQQKNVAADEASNAADRAKGLAQNKVNQLSNNMSEDDKNKAREQADRARGTAENYKNRTIDYAKEKFPEERREKFIYRLKKVVVEQQKHDDYNSAIDFFFDILEKYKGRTQEVAGQAGNKAGDVRSDPAYANAEMELRILLERFANDTSMQPIIDAVDQLYADSRDDPELRQWWSKFGSYVRDVLQDEGYVMTDECSDQGKRLQESGKQFWDEKYRGHREDLFHAVEEFFLAYNEDPLNKRLGEGVKRVVKQLALDGDGNMKYKPHLINDLRKVIIPSIASQIGYIPIPRAEYQDKTFDIVIENLTLEMANLIPNLIEIENKNYFKISPYENQGDFQQHAFMIGFSQVQADLRDVAFYFKKKSGFPKLQDSGLADVVISGKGIYGSIKLETTPNKSSYFKVDHVDINIDDLKFKIRDSKHNFLYNSLRGAATTIIKKAVCKAAEAGIRQALVQLDQQLTDIRDASDEASRRDDVSRTELIKQRMEQKKQKGEEKKQKAENVAKERQSEFRLVTTREQEGVNWESKASYVGKAGEGEKLAQSGDRNGWKSPVFDITHAPLQNKEIASANPTERRHA